MKIIFMLLVLMTGCAKRIIIPAREHSQNLAMLETLRQEKESARFDVYLMEAERDVVRNELSFFKRELARCRKTQESNPTKKAPIKKK